MLIISPWQIKLIGKSLGSLLNEMVESDMRESAQQRKLAYEKEEEKIRKRIQQKEEEDEYKRKNPHATWMFNHFNFGEDYIFYKTLY